MLPSFNRRTSLFLLIDLSIQLLILLSFLVFFILFPTQSFSIERVFSDIVAIAGMPLPAFQLLSIIFFIIYFYRHRNLVDWGFDIRILHFFFSIIYIPLGFTGYFGLGPEFFAFNAVLSMLYFLFTLYSFFKFKKMST